MTGQGDIRGRDTPCPSLRRGEKRGCYALTANGLGNHQLFDPGDRPVGKERSVMTPEQVAHDQATIAHGDKHQSVSPIYQLGERLIE